MALDFSTLTAETEDLSPITRNREVDYGPFPAWLKESKEDGKGRAVTVPASEAKAVQNLIRRAANSLGMGCAVQVVEDGDTAKVRFIGKDKRQYDETKPRKPVRGEMSDSEFAAALRDYSEKLSAYGVESGTSDKIAKIVAKIGGEITALTKPSESAAPVAKPAAVKPAPTAARKSA